MPGITNDLQGVREGHRKFVQEKDFWPAMHQPHLVRWVREFLVFAQTHRGYSFEQPCQKGEVHLMTFVLTIVGPVPLTFPMPVACDQPPER